MSLLRPLLVLSFIAAAPGTVAFPSAASAQSGAITFDRAVRYAFELPEQVRERVGDRIPGESFESLVLLFSPTETVMLPAPDPEPEEGQEPLLAYRLVMPGWPVARPHSRDFDTPAANSG